MKSLWMRSKPLRVTVFVVLGAIALVVFGFVVMWLWNELVPSLFGGPTITWPQALGLFALSRILFGGWGSDNSEKKKKEDDCDDDEKRLDELSPAERARLKEMLREGLTGDAVRPRS